ncbi:MAG: hypothetical protein SOR68_01450 [Campylobacter hyointestinalis]|nr:hypothetical protein [Campylobacter hyointestinalis]
MTAIEKASKMTLKEIQQMSVEDYEVLLKQCLEEMYPKYAQILLNRYQEDLEEFLRDCLKPNVAATAMMMGY